MLRFSVLFSLMSTGSAIFYGEYNSLDLMIRIGEIYLIWQWDALENDDDRELYEKCFDAFKSYDDAAYFVSFNVVTAKIAPAMKEDLVQKNNNRKWWREARLRIPVALALIFNVCLMVYALMGVILCMRKCSPFAIPCYSLILVPRIVIFVLTTAFLVLCHKKYLKKHWSTSK